MKSNERFEQSKIVVLCGISGSGKSTFASSMVQVAPKLCTIVNRDKIRELLFGYTEETITEYYTRKDIRSLEKEVSKYEDLLIKEALNSGKTPIVDATHLSVKYLERFKYWNVPVELQMFPVPVEIALDRCSRRTRKVPKEVIEKQFNQYKSLVSSLKNNPIDFTPVTLDNGVSVKNLIPCVIFDIDGTIAHKGNRSPYDWKRVGEDTVDFPTQFMLNTIAESYPNTPLKPKVIICTGRDGVCLDETKQWLKDNNFMYDVIFIREENDMRPDWVIKEEIWREIVKNHWIIGMFDDREQVVNRARALGLKVFQCEYNNF